VALQVYNTLKRTKEPLVPLKAGTVRMYACGVTVYDDCHLGHARSAVNFDVIRRYLEYKGITVDFVVNFTDVDDKIIRRANQEQTDSASIAGRYIENYFRDMDALGIRRASNYPKATENIGKMQEMIAVLVQKGHAYVESGDVFFDVSSFSGYGKLSGRDPDDQMDGARVAVDDKKHNPRDFALWKASKPGEPVWPFELDGNDLPGRPGWHIECSVMAPENLGETIDIHGGGTDLIFPHHENEIAQSEAYSDNPFARYWLHNGMIRFGADKMSKSLGNIVPISDLIEKYSGEVIRFFILTCHYRSPLNYAGEEKLEEARKALDRLYAARDVVADWASAGLDGDSHVSAGLYEEEDFTELQSVCMDVSTRFTNAMDDDFNTPEALASMFDLSRKVLQIKARLDASGFSAGISLALAAAEVNEIFSAWGGVLGILQEETLSVPRLADSDMAVIKGDLNDIASELTEHERPDLETWLRDEIESAGRVPDKERFAAMIDLAVELRSRCRRERLYQVSDTIRDRLKEHNVIVEDKKDGTSAWRVER